MEKKDTKISAKKFINRGLTVLEAWLRRDRL